MSEWNPDADFLSEVLNLLMVLEDPTSNDHVQAQDALAEHIHNPEFIPYLGFVLPTSFLLFSLFFSLCLYTASMLNSFAFLAIVRIFSTPLEGVGLSLRELAGLIVKREVIKRFEEASEDLRCFLQEELISSMAGKYAIP